MTVQKTTKLTSWRGLWPHSRHFENKLQQVTENERQANAKFVNKKVKEEGAGLLDRSKEITYRCNNRSIQLHGKVRGVCESYNRMQ